MQLIKYRPAPRLFPRTKLMGRIKLGAFFSLPEDKFKEYINKLEENELFQELLKKYKIVKYRKFSGIKQSPQHLILKEEITPAESFDPLELIQRYPNSWEVVKKVAIKIGEEKFSLFLKGKNTISIRKIIRECNLSSQEAEKFKEFINSFQLQESFFSQDYGTAPPRPRNFKVAYIQKDRKELLIIPLEDSDYLVRGRYFIDYKKWENLIQEKQIPLDKIKDISTLFRKLDMINQRTTTLYRVLLSIKKTQHDFFISGNPGDIRPLSQLSVARNLHINPSTISRTIAGKSIICPWGEEKALKEFFLREKERNKILILQIIKEERKNIKEGTLTHPLSDDGIRKKLKNISGIRVARRTVAKYRKELKIPSSKERKALYKLTE